MKTKKIINIYSFAIEKEQDGYRAYLRDFPIICTHGISTRDAQDKLRIITHAFCN